MSDKANNSIHTDGALRPKIDLTDEEWKKLHRVYDKDGDGHMSDEEILKLIEDFNEKKLPNEGIEEILKKFDTNNSGNIDKREMLNLKHHFYEYEAAQYTRYVYLSINFNTYENIIVKLFYSH